MKKLLLTIIVTTLIGLESNTSRFWASHGQTISHSSEIPTSQEIKFIREVTYGETQKVLLSTIEDIAVDKNNRVFIADDDQMVIHVYKKNGTYLKSLGRSGRGPGEFRGISSIKIKNGNLYAADGTPYPGLINIYSLESLDFSHAIKLLATNKNEFGELKARLIDEFYLVNDDNVLVRYIRPYDRSAPEQRYLRYYIQNEDGKIISEEIFRQDDIRYNPYVYPSGYTVALTFPFQSRALFRVSNDGYLYSADTEDFVIKKHNSRGKFLNKIQHSFTNTSFDEDEFTENVEHDGLVPMLNNMDLPEFWPALDEIIIDNENRLWVSTIVQNDEIYKWWLLDETGEVITKFEWPRSKPIKAVQNGYLYTQETDERGIDEIVRYKIIL